ncbi:hypothetical protein Ancab_014240 [Ancistrocladus abbreviatus]
MSSSSNSSKITTGKRLEGKVAIITGGASGLGEYTAKLFLSHGAKVIIADVQDDLGQSLCKDHASSDISYIHCDVTSDSDVKNLIDITMSEHGRLDIMHSNAGISGQLAEMAILNAENDDFKRVLEVNLYGAFLCAKHAARVMVPAKKGVILFTASIASVVSGMGSHAYTVSKVAIVGLARSLCVDLGKYGIRVNCISPAAVPTPMARNTFNFDRSTVQKLYESSAVLKGAVLTEEDVAEVAVFLASDESKVISGQNVVVDGGYSTTNPAFVMKLEELTSSSNYSI